MTHRQRVYVMLLLTGWLTAAAFMPMTVSPVRFLAVMGTVALVAWAVAWTYDVFSDLRATRRRCDAVREERTR